MTSVAKDSPVIFDSSKPSYPLAVPINSGFPSYDGSRSCGAL